MFYYSDTGKLSKPGELQRKAVTEIRKVTYLTNSRDPKVTEPVMTEGFETVTEVPVSPEYNGTPRLVGSKTVDNRNAIVKQIKPKEDTED